MDYAAEKSVWMM